MKKLYNLVLIKSSVMIAAIYLCFVSGRSLAQPCNSFNAANVGSLNSTCSSGVTTIPNVTHSGMDARQTSTTGLPAQMEVHVWDGDYPGLSWFYAGASSHCSIALPSGSVNTRVALIESGGSSTPRTWYAIVVYADGSNECHCDMYEWDNSYLVFNSTPVNSATLQSTSSSASSTVYALMNTTININAVTTGQFVIVWDDANDNEIELITGEANSSSYPTLSGTRSLRTPGHSTNSDDKSPDVSIYSTSTSNPLVFFTYCERSSSGNPYQTIRVDGDDFSDLSSNLSSSLNFAVISTPTNTGEFDKPRIACPHYVSGNDDQAWTVVAELADYNSNSVQNIHDIIGFTFPDHSNPATYYTNIYTDGSQGLCAISDDYYGFHNSDPVVSYVLGELDGMMVGWTSDYSLSSNFNPTAPVALACQKNGEIQQGCYNQTGTVLDYLIVPSINPSTNTGQSALSISGRDYLNNNEMLYCYYDDNISDLAFKRNAIQFCNTNYSLRTRNNKQQQGVTTDVSILAMPNPFNNDLTINFTNIESAQLCIMDVTGNMLLKTSGNEQEINKFLRNEIHKLSSGIYLLNTISDDGSVIYNDKLIKM